MTIEDFTGDVDVDSKEEHILDSDDMFVQVDGPYNATITHTVDGLSGCINPLLQELHNKP